MKLNFYYQFKSAYPIDERFNRKYDKNWILHQNSFMLLRESCEIATATIPNLSKMAVDGSAFSLFDAHFVINYGDWTQIDKLFSKR